MILKEFRDVKKNGDVVSSLKYYLHVRNADIIIPPEIDGEFFYSWC